MELKRHDLDMIWTFTRFTPGYMESGVKFSNKAYILYVKNVLCPLTRVSQNLLCRRRRGSLDYSC